MTVFYDDDLKRRAFAAYWRSEKREGGSYDIPGASCSGFQRHGGKGYVVLRNNYRVLAVYRVTNRGILKGLKRWPKALEVY